MARALVDGLPTNLAELSAAIQRSFGPDLELYVQSLKQHELPRSFKVINDPIWYTIRVESWELPILDSPVVQRLRQIHQLGLAGLVYPAAGYSRFEHSIGALFQTQRVIESINRNARAYSAQKHVSIEEPISRADEALLRLAAILHDVGHCFLSHVSERALMRLRTVGEHSIEEIRRAAKGYFGCAKEPALGETLSALLILIPQFQDVLAIAQIPSWTGNELELARLLAKLIVGGRIPDRPFMSEIISGTLDADKLDYMARDCYMAGLAMPIDTERLLEKLNIVAVPVQHIPEYSEAAGLEPNRTVQVLAIQQGGAKVFEDFVLSRVLLYDKLYNHHKVRALEGYLINVVEMLNAAAPTTTSLDSMLRLTDAQILEGWWLQASSGSQHMRRAHRMISDVRERNVVRAFAFGSYLQPEQGGSGTSRIVGKRWRGLAAVTQRKTTDAVLAFRKKLAERAKQYQRALGQPELADEIDEYAVVVDLPDVQGIASKTKFFVGDENVGVRFFNELFKVDNWSEAYENQKLTGYVFCPEQYAIAVHLAFRDLAREDFQLSFEPWSWSLTKLRADRLAIASQRLADGGVPTKPISIPDDIKERESYLSSRDAKALTVDRNRDVICQLARRFASYQPHTGDTMSEHRIRDWLMQFTSGEMLDALVILQHVQYWDRSRLTDALATLDWADDLRNAQWIPLTTSGAQLTYLWEDLRGGGKCPDILSASVDQLKKDIPIIFYEDNVESAGQAKTVLQQWIGVPQDEWIVDEKHAEPLAVDKTDILRSVPIKFLFVTGQRNGLKSLVEFAKRKLGNDQISGYIISPQDGSCFRPSSGIFDNRESADRARDIFSRAGRIAISDKCEEWGAEKTGDRILGYGNSGGLTVFYYNVPASTVTALWRSCMTGETRWMGLFPRRTRL